MTLEARASCSSSLCSSSRSTPLKHVHPPLTHSACLLEAATPETYALFTVRLASTRLTYLTKYIPTSDDRRFWFYDYVLGHTHVHVPCV